MASHSEQWPGRPPGIVAKIVEVEQELDVTWPGWRTKQPFGHLDYDRLARVKYLLKRHALLTYEEDGVPTPRDWKVIVMRDKANPNKCFAHPVAPDRPLTGDATVPPPVVSIPMAAPLTLSASEVAFKHQVPLEHVEAAIAMLPPHADEASVVSVARYLARPAPAVAP